MKLAFRKATEYDKLLIRTLLEQTRLPTESLQHNVTEFYLATENGKVVGAAGFEVYGGDALLRSVAVQPQLQKTGIGSRFVEFMIREAKEKRIERIVLLTETAKSFFERNGFAVVARDSIGNDALKLSSEFTYACPASAACMVLEVSGNRRSVGRG